MDKIETTVGLIHLYHLKVQYCSRKNGEYSYESFQFASESDMASIAREKTRTHLLNNNHIISVAEIPFDRRFVTKKGNNVFARFKECPGCQKGMPYKDGFHYFHNKKNVKCYCPDLFSLEDLKQTY